MKKKSIEVFEVFLTSAIKYFKWIVVVAVAIIALTGVYKVDSHEVAVVLRFGALTGATREEQIKQPGLHFTLPNFIDEVIKIPVETVQELKITTLYNAGDTVGGNIQNKGYVLTGDSNIVLMKIVAKYKVSDPLTYALYINDAESMLNGVISSEMTTLVTKATVDDVLTTEKTVISAQTMRNAQDVINRLGIGVEITNIELTDITPPPEATEAFNNATTASVKKQTLIQQANDYRESAIPEAEAKAQTLIDTATADQASAVADATAIVEEFNGLYEQYVMNPAVVRNGVFRSRVAAVLEKSGAMIVAPDKNGDATKVILP